MSAYRGRGRGLLCRRREEGTGDSELICQIQHHPLRFFPAQAGIRDALSVNALFRLLAPILQIAFNHQTFDDGSDILIHPHGMEYFLGDPGLLLELFA